MTDWQPIDTAPRDGTVIRVRTKGERVLLASWQSGLVDELENECGGWFAEDEATQPSCWTDGVCWEQNADDEKSDQPIKWEPA